MSEIKLVESAPEDSPGMLDAFDGETFVKLVPGDLNESEQEVVVEGSKLKVLGKAEGRAAQGDIVNKNRRFYSNTVYKLAVERAKPLLAKGRFLGEVDHPWVGSLRGAAFRFTKLEFTEGFLDFEGLILDTSGGRELKGLLDGGVMPGVSTRGYGSVEWEEMEVDGKTVNVAIIQEDYHMEGIDFVLFPSNPAGEVKKHESQDRSKNDIPSQEAKAMDIETLRNEHPDLVAAVEAEAREGYVSQEDHETALEGARQEGREAAQAEASNAETMLSNAISGVVEGLAPFSPELKQMLDAVKESEEDAELTAAQERISALEAELEAATTKNEEDEARAAIEAHVESILTDCSFADDVREQLLALESVESIDTAFAAMQSIATRLEAQGKVDEEEEPGTGVSEETDEGDDATASELTEEQKTHRQLAGLPSTD